MKLSGMNPRKVMLAARAAIRKNAEAKKEAK